MRRLCTLLVASTLACGGKQPPPATPVAPPAAAASAVAPSSLPAEPAGLVAIATPAAVCVLTGKDTAFSLGGTSAGTALLDVSAGPSDATVERGGAAFIEATTPVWAVHGLVPAGALSVRPARFIAFGGVLFAGVRDQLVVKNAHDGNLVVDAPHTDGFVLDPAHATAEIPCNDASLSTNPGGALLRDVPSPFVATGTTKRMQLKKAVVIPVAAQPNGAAIGSFGASPDPATVVVLETRGKSARVRYGHIAGWIDTSLLAPPPKLTDAARLSAFLNAAGPGTIAAISTSSTTPASSRIECPNEVRVIAEVQATHERYVAGRIVAGKAFGLADAGSDLTYLALNDGRLHPRSGVRFAVPSRDVAACTASTAMDESRTSSTAQNAAVEHDAIDALDGAFSASGGPAAWPLFGADASVASRPMLRTGAVQANGHLPAEVITRIVRQSFSRLLLCYKDGLRRNPALSGQVSVKFGIDRSGSVSAAQDDGSSLPDTKVVACVVRGFTTLSFPQPEGGTVSVVYPIQFDPGTSDHAPSK